MPVIYQTNYEKHYKAECCSCVSIVTLAVYLFTLIVAYLFVYETNGLWR